MHDGLGTGRTFGDLLRKHLEIVRIVDILYVDTKLDVLVDIITSVLS
jgi:hypothetical protein